MKDWNQDGRKDGRKEGRNEWTQLESQILGWICWVWLLKKKPWITNWTHLYRNHWEAVRIKLCPHFHTNAFQMRAAFSIAQDLQNMHWEPSSRLSALVCWDLLYAIYICPRNSLASNWHKHDDNYIASTSLLIFYTTEWIVAFQY